jgi:hypothetical protein
MTKINNFGVLVWWVKPPWVKTTLIFKFYIGQKMKKMIKEITKNGSFTDADLEIVKSLLNIEAYPQFYKPYDGTEYSLPEGVEYVGTIITDAKALTREGTIGSSQPTRATGGNQKREELARDIFETGWKLFCSPISVIQRNNKIIFLDGRTKDKILLEVKYGNRIVRLYKFVGEHENDVDLQDDAIEDFGLEGNEEPYTAGYNVQADFFEVGKKKVSRGTLEPTQSAILAYWLQLNNEW